MEKINAAFDEIMANLRAGQQGTTDSDFQAKSQQGQTGGTVGKWAEIRGLINAGRVDEAMAQLNAIPNGAAQAEWNFLMGSAFYYKGWMNEAFQYFQRLVVWLLAIGNMRQPCAICKMPKVDGCPAIPMALMVPPVGRL